MSVQLLDNICRSCLFEEQNMKSVFDTDSSMGETMQLAQMLMACTCVQVAEGDGLPTQICLSCINHLARLFTFKKLCEDSDATLRKLLGNVTLITDYDDALIAMKPSINVALPSQELLANIDRDILLNLGMKFEEGETNSDVLISSNANEFTICANDDIQMMNNAANLESETIQITNNLNVKPGQISGVPMPDKIDLPHLNTLIIDNEQQSISAMRDDREHAMYSCKECTVSFTVENDLKVTDKKVYFEEKQRLTEPKCNVDSQELASSKTMKRHMKLRNDDRRHAEPHTDEKGFVCKLCDKEFVQLNRFIQHMCGHTKGKDTSSEYGRGFVRRRHSTHTKSRTSRVKDNICSDCGKRFATAGTLKTHRQTHTGERPFTCNVCDKRCRTRANLDCHLRLHSGEKPYVCNVCEKRFRSLTNLLSHLQKHPGEKPYRCELCAQQFAYSAQLRMHKKTRCAPPSSNVQPSAQQAEEREYICHVCDERFRSRSYFIAHVRTHRGEKRHMCSVCDQRFATASEVKLHMRTPASEKPYQCHLCAKAFPRSEDLHISR